jgi:hypothetical protein
MPDHNNTPCQTFPHHAKPFHTMQDNSVPCQTFPYPVRSFHIVPHAPCGTFKPCQALLNDVSQRVNQQVQWFAPNKGQEDISSLKACLDKSECIHLSIARILSQFESLGFVGKYDQSPTNIVNSWTLKYGGAEFLQNPRIFSLQNGPRMRANSKLPEYNVF